MVKWIFEVLISDDIESKRYIREEVTTAEWFDGYGILKLSEKLFTDSRAGWGRAKRNAVAAWYLNRPLKLVKEQIESSPVVSKICHGDIILFLHITDLCTEQDRFNYLSSISEKTEEAKPPTTENNTTEKKGFWTFLSELLGV